MTEEAETAEKKGGFFRKLMKIAFIAAIVAAVVQFVKRRRGSESTTRNGRNCRRRPAASPLGRGPLGEPTRPRPRPAWTCARSRRSRTATASWR